MKMLDSWSTTVLTVLILLSIGVAADDTWAAGGGIEWVSYDEGTQRGKAENKKVFMVFGKDYYMGY